MKKDTSAANIYLYKCEFGRTELALSLGEASSSQYGSDKKNVAVIVDKTMTQCTCRKKIAPRTTLHFLSEK